MVQYLNQKLVDFSFKRLAPKTNAGKKPRERTSALMCFLSFDAAVKNLDCCPLDMNPKTADGRDNRHAMELEFVKLVTLKSAADMKIRQVSVLGKTETGGKSPEKRFSSNFLTVPLKNASEAIKAFNYPRRPASVLKMGPSSTELKWGIDHHDEWRTNLPKLLNEVKSNTPFTDLAIFVFRDGKISAEINNIRDALAEMIKVRFTEDLASFWIKRMEAEKVFFKHGDDPFRDSHQEALAETSAPEKSSASDSGALKSLDKQILVDRVVYLEGLLDAQDIEYRSITN